MIDASLESFIFEITGATDKIDKFVSLMIPLGLVEVSRTGVAAISAARKGWERARRRRDCRFDPCGVRIYIVYPKGRGDEGQDQQMGQQPSLTPAEALGG